MQAATPALLALALRWCRTDTIHWSTDAENESADLHEGVKRLLGLPVQAGTELPVFAVCPGCGAIPPSSLGWQVLLLLGPIEKDGCPPTVAIARRFCSPSFSVALTVPP